MPVQFTLRAFFLHVPNELLKSYFDSREELRGFEWDRFALAASDPLHDAWSALPEASRLQTECELRAVAELATPEGLGVLADQGREHGLDLIREFHACHGSWHKAFLVFVRYRRVFDAARQLHEVDHLHGRYWHQRTDMPRCVPDETPATRAALGHSLSAYYKPQDRAAYCHVDGYRRGDKRVYVAYPQDVAEAVLGYERGRLRSQSQRSVFEVVFAYDPNAGTLDIHAQGGKAVKRDLQRLFARVVLGQELPPESRPTPYRLNLLKNRGFSFPTDPADGIREVRVKQLRLAIIGGGRVNFDACALRDRNDVYDLMGGYLQARDLPPSNVDIDHVTMQMVFAYAQGPQVLTFGLRPDSCTLRDAPEHLVAKRCLKRWEIACAG